MNGNMIAALGLAGLLAACNSNTAPGNDKLAELDKTPAAAPQLGAVAALANVSPGGLYPGILNKADIASIGDTKGRCVFRMTKVGFPSFVYGGSQQEGTIKLNGKLVMLPARSATTYADGGLTVDMQQRAGAEEEATMIMRIAGAPDELGFRGFANCNG